MSLIRFRRAIEGPRERAERSGEGHSNKSCRFLRRRDGTETIDEVICKANIHFEGLTNLLIIYYFRQTCSIRESFSVRCKRSSRSNLLS